MSIVRGYARLQDLDIQLVLLQGVPLAVPAGDFDSAHKASEFRLSGRGLCGIRLGVGLSVLSWTVL